MWYFRIPKLYFKGVGKSAYPSPFSIGRADIYLAKTDKSMGFHFQTEEEETYQIQLSSETVVIQDAQNRYFYIQYRKFGAQTKGMWQETHH